MNRKAKMKIINRAMMFSLILVMATGILLRSLPGMWMGIIHGVSGITLTVSIVIHCLQHRGKKVS